MARSDEAIERNKKLNDSLNDVNKERRDLAEKKLQSFKKTTDEFEGSSFYRDSRAPNYTNIDFIYPYIGEKGDRFWLRLKMQYEADDWLFIDNAIFLVDGEKYPVSGNWERDNDGGRIWEWLDLPVEPSGVMLLEKIANSQTTKVRFVGNKYHNDRTLTKKEKDIIKNTLEIYQALN